MTGVVPEAASLVCFSLLTRSLLAAGSPRLWWVLRCDLTGLGVGHVLPGGGASATALRYRLLRRGGASPDQVAVALGLEGAVTTVVLAALVWLALVASVVVPGLHPRHLTTHVVAALVGALVIAALVTATLLRSREAGPAAHLVHAAIDRLPRRVRPRVTDAVRDAVAAVGDLVTDRRTVSRSLLWAVGNCVFDAASLWVFLAAYGHRLAPLGLFEAYGVATLLAVLPISPGGLGVIEAALIPALVGLGTPSAVAVLGVVSWRLPQFWAPIPLAGPGYLSLRAQSWWTDRRARVGTGPSALGPPVAAP